MNIHKFNVKPINYPAKTIKWMIPDQLRQYFKKVNSTTWEVYAQNVLIYLILKPKEPKFLMLLMGFKMCGGFVLTSLNDQLTLKRVSLQNGIYLTDTQNMIIVLTNNTSENIIIPKLSMLCLVCYKKL